MTEFNKPRPEEDWDALAEKVLGRAQDRAYAEYAKLNGDSLNPKRQLAQTDYGLLEHKLAVYEVQRRNQTIEEVALHIEKLKGFGQDTISSLAIYIREMKK